MDEKKKEEVFILVVENSRLFVGLFSEEFLPFLLGYKYSRSTDFGECLLRVTPARLACRKMNRLADADCYFQLCLHLAISDLTKYSRP